MQERRLAYFHTPEELKREIEIAGFKGVDVRGVIGSCWLIRNLDEAWEDTIKRDYYEGSTFAGKRGKHYGIVNAFSEYFEENLSENRVSCSLFDKVLPEKPAKLTVVYNS